MFGYVKICKDELKIKDYRLFTAYYCGLCKAIGNRASPLLRLGLSYDMVFLAILLTAAEDKSILLKNSGCILHPLKNRSVVYGCEAVNYAADMNILLAYLKFDDDRQDEHSIKAYLGMTVCRRAAEKVRLKHENIYNGIVSELSKLYALERTGCKDISAVSGHFAEVLKILFVPEFITDCTARRILENIGENIGHWIYTADAFVDIEHDIKKRNYNPFVQKYGLKSIDDVYTSGIAEKVRTFLDDTSEKIILAYELLTVYQNDDILRNIIYMGLKNTQNQILRSF